MPLAHPVTRRTLMRISALVSALVLGALAQGADSAPKPADLIIGKWRGEDSTFTVGSPDKKNDKVYFRKTTIEFRKDGTFQLTMAGIPELKEILPEEAKDQVRTAKYAFVTDTEMEVTAMQDGKEV